MNGRMAALAGIAVALLALASACGPEFDDPYYDDAVRVVSDGGWSAFMASWQLEDKVDRRTRSEQLGDAYACQGIDWWVENLQETYVDLRRDLERLDPPEEAARWHRDFLRVITESIEAIDDSRNAVVRGDGPALDGALNRLERLTEDGAELIDRFNDDFNRTGAPRWP